MDAKKVQALRGSHIVIKDDKTLYTDPRYLSKPNWMKSDSNVMEAKAGGGTQVERIFHPGMTDGIFRWTVEILKLPTKGKWNEIILAFATKSQRLMWGFSSTGHCRAIKGDGFLVRYTNKPTFKAGSVVRLELNLDRKSPMRGMLSCSVNDGPTVLLCTDMLHELEGEDGTTQAIFPVALVSPGASIKSIRLQNVEPPKKKR